MTVTVYELGDIVRLEGTFSNIAGTLADPSAVTLKVLTPDGTMGTLTGTDGTGTGYWYYDYTVAQAGRHYYWWLGTGNVETVEGYEFDVVPRP